MTEENQTVINVIVRAVNTFPEGKLSQKDHNIWGALRLAESRITSLDNEQNSFSGLLRLLLKLIRTRLGSVLLRSASEEL